MEKLKRVYPESRAELRRNIGRFVLENKPLWSAREIIADVMWRTNTKPYMLAQRMNIPRQNVNFYRGKMDGAKKRDMRCESLSWALRCMGFVLVAIPMDFKIGDPMYCVDWRGRGSELGKSIKEKTEEDGGSKDNK